MHRARTLDRIVAVIVAREPAELRVALGQTIVGQEGVIEALLLALLCNGHVLLEGPPGLAKTLACRSLAAALEGEFKRIQFTPDLLPSDIVGTRIFDQRESAFATVLGPIFANVVLADEINRAPAKVQSALLEAMQERQVTIGLQSYALPDPFIVMATMNPLDSEGTYTLPIAQMDRFLMKVNVGYPSREEELSILDRFAVADTQPVRAIATLDDVRAWRAQAHAVHIDEKLKRYIVELVAVTRQADRVTVRSHSGAPLRVAELIDYGASPRATLALAFLARGRALLARRDFALPDDVRAVAPHALRHRIGFNYRLAAEGVAADAVIDAIIGAVRAP
jgi:MoxR-like ATPase